MMMTLDGKNDPFISVRNMHSFTLMSNSKRRGENPFE